MRYTFADNELNTDTQELWRRGEPVHTEPQVLKVLLHLIANRDRVVTKLELLDEVWGDRFVSESALTSRIKSARQACGDTGKEQRIIRTVHGLGYRFVAEIADDMAGARIPPAGGAPRSDSGGLIGRLVELELLDAAADQAARGARRLVFVTGEPGVGKTAFLSEFVERIDAVDQWHILRGNCLQSRSGTEPYFCLLDALSRMARTDADLIRDLLDEVAPAWLAQLPSLIDADHAERLGRRLLGSTPHRMVREGADVFEALARSRPVVLLLEDLHWIDDCSLDVLDLLAQRVEPARLLIVASSRHGASAANDLITRTTTSGSATEVSLGSLAPEAVEALVSNWFDHAEVPEELVEIVQRRSDGLPIFILEMLDAWTRSGHVIATPDGVLVSGSTAAIEAQVPDTLRQLVEQDLARLEPATVEALERGAVAGIEFDSASVAAAMNEPLDAVEQLLSESARSLRYVDTVGGNLWPDNTISTRFSFTHDLYQQVLYDRLAPPQRRQAHLLIGEALEAGHVGRLQEVVVPLAEHFTRGGDQHRAIEYLRQAGEQAASRNAFGLAASSLSEALARASELEPGPERDQSELRIRMALGPTLVATRGWFGDEVAENYERAMELCAGQQTCPEAPFARYGLATVTELRGEYDRTEALLQPMFEEAGNELLTEAHELLACSLFHQGEFQRSVESATAVLDAWDGEYASPLMSRLAEHPASACNSWASLATWFLGGADESIRLAERAVMIGEEHLYALSTARVQRAFLHQLRDEPEQCREWADATVEIAEAQGFPMRAIQAQMLLGWCDARLDDPSAGRDRIRRGLEEFQATGARLTEPYFVGLLAEAEFAAGDNAAAAASLDHAISTMLERSRTFFFAPELHRLRAAVWLANGLPGDQVRTEVDRAADSARALGAPSMLLRALCDAVRLDPPSAGPDLLGELTRVVAHFDGQRETADVRDARALLAERA